MEMKKNRLRLKLTIFIIASVLLIVGVVIAVNINSEENRYPEAKKIEMGNVYMGSGIYGGAPSENSNRYYIELREDGTYSLLDDSTWDVEQEVSIMDFAVGTYQKQDDVYLLDPKEGAMVRFTLSMDRVLEIERIEGDELYQERSICKYEGETIVLSNKHPNEMKADDENLGIDILYKADRNNLPNTVDKFLKKYEEKYEKTKNASDD